MRRRHRSPSRPADPRGGVEAYEHADAGRLAAVTCPTGRATTFAYDDAGRLAAETDPASETTAYEHDADGRLVAVVTPEGRETAFELDAVGRVIAETTAGATARYAHDPLGRVTSVVDAATATPRSPTWPATGALFFLCALLEFGVWFAGRPRAHSD